MDQLIVLASAILLGYITDEKKFRDNYTLTTAMISQKGVTAFENYVKALKAYYQVIFY